MKLVVPARRYDATALEWRPISIEYLDIASTVLVMVHACDNVNNDGTVRAVSKEFDSRIPHLREHIGPGVARLRPLVREVMWAVSNVKPHNLRISPLAGYKEGDRVLIDYTWLYESNNDMRKMVEQEGIKTVLIAGYDAGICLVWSAHGAFNWTGSGARCVVLEDLTSARLPGMQDRQELTRITVNWLGTIYSVSSSAHIAQATYQHWFDNSPK